MNSASSSSPVFPQWRIWWLNKLIVPLIACSLCFITMIESKQEQTLRVAHDKHDFLLILLLNCCPVWLVLVVRWATVVGTGGIGKKLKSKNTLGLLVMNDKSLLPHWKVEHPSSLYRKTPTPATKGPEGSGIGRKSRVMEFLKETNVRRERHKVTVRRKNGREAWGEAWVRKRHALLHCVIITVFCCCTSASYCVKNF